MFALSTSCAAALEMCTLGDEASAVLSPASERVAFGEPCAVYADKRNLPSRVRVFLDFLAELDKRRLDVAGPVPEG